MNDLGTPPPDWDGIFDRARRRIVGRFVLVGVIGGLCAVLLLGGGLAAQGAIPVRIPGSGGDSEETRIGTEAKRTEKKKHIEKQKKEEEHKGHPEEGKPKHPKHCTEKSEGSAEREYGNWDGPSKPTGHKCPS